MKEKWTLIGDDKVDKFYDYYTDTWVKSKESNWFAGAGSLDHNNGLEAKNNDLKKTKLIRTKQKVGAFYNNCKIIVYKESKLNDKEVRLWCDPMDLITLNDQKEGWKWLQQKKKSSYIVMIKDKYYVLSSSAPKNTILMDAA